MLIEGIGEYALVKQLTPSQRSELRDIVDNQTLLRDITADKVFKEGKVDTNKGCFSLVLVGHLSSDNFPPAADYATYVTGSPNDFLVIDKDGDPTAFYDGKLNQSGAAYSLFQSQMNRPTPPILVAEAKYGYGWLNKYIKPLNQLPPGFFRSPSLAYNPTPASNAQVDAHAHLVSEIDNEVKVANKCGLLFFVSFNNYQAYLAGLELLNYPATRVISDSAAVYNIPY